MIARTLAFQTRAAMLVTGIAAVGLSACTPAPAPPRDETMLVLSRADYASRLHGFWLGQSIGNWTGLVTEMDKIGGDGPHGVF
ncbi:MAG: hypothetical protein VX501_06925 [Pseudomonadota bacterium]|nr:hypothetical protein [Pseudomonadota bacterium]